MRNRSFELAIGGSCIELTNQLERTFRFRGLPPATAEDLAQETLLRALSNWDRFDHEKGHARAWVFQIAKNTLNSFYKKDQRERQRRLFADDQISVGDAFVRSEQLMLLSAATEFISKNFDSTDRQILVMKLAQKSSLEIAEFLGIDRKTVTNRLVSMRKRLGRFE